MDKDEQFVIPPEINLVHFETPELVTNTTMQLRIATQVIVCIHSISTIESQLLNTFDF